MTEQGYGIMLWLQIYILQISMNLRLVICVYSVTYVDYDIICNISFYIKM